MRRERQARETGARTHRRPGGVGFVVALAGVALGTWLSVRNDADAASVLVTGVAGLVVGAALSRLSDTLFAIGFLVAFIGGLLLHIAVAGSVAPLWPFALFLGLTIGQQIRTPAR